MPAIALKDIPKYTAAQVDAVVQALAALPSGDYRVTEDFNNPIHTNDRAYGAEGQRIVAAGTLVRIRCTVREDCVADSDSVSFRLQVGPASRPWLAGRVSARHQSVIQSYGYSRTLDATSRRACLFAETLLACVQRVDQTLGTVLAAQGGTRCDADLLALLLEREHFTLADVEQTVEALDAMFASECEALRRRNGLA